MMRKWLTNVLQLIFFGNYFYGICVITLTIEAALQQNIPQPPILYYGILFCITIVYYSWACINERSGYPSNERTAWYLKHRSQIQISLISLSFIALVLLFLFLRKNWQLYWNLSLFEFSLLAIFPFFSLLYYGLGAKFNLRSFGLLKPFLIGFAWAGIVTWYPLILHCITNKLQFHFNVVNIVLFLKNFMFIGVLCILFDIKDYAADANRNLQTFIVRTGLRNTLFFIVIPLSLIGLGIYIIYAVTHALNWYKIGINILPFILLMLASYSLKKRKPLLYYLIFIDGLMLVKGICGMLAMV